MDERLLVVINSQLLILNRMYDSMGPDADYKSLINAMEDLKDIKKQIESGYSNE